MEEWDGSLKNSVLLIWDAQYGIATRAFNISNILKNIKVLRSTMHLLDKLVIYTQTTGLPFEHQNKYSMYRLRRRGLDPKISHFMQEGSREWNIMKEIAPNKEKDIVIKKYTPSLFVGTNAEQLLRNRGVDVLVITGVSTEVGVETTARHASCLGFIPLIVEDSVGSGDKRIHKASIEVMRKMFEVKTTREVMEILQAQ
jgi:nicotinamidase-related amidase